MIITSKTPKLDLHHEIGSMVESLVNEFILDNYKMHQNVIIIIHGISGKVVKTRLYEVLSENKLVEKYYVDNWNIGQTIVELKTRP